MMSTARISTYFTAFIIALCFYVFSSVVPYYSDDWWHSFVHQPDGSYPTERIDNWSDIITSQVNHYMNKNGRLPITLVAQTVVSFCSKPVFNFINTLFFTLTTILLAQYCFSRIDASKLIISATSIFYILPGHYDVMMWASGAIYYLWVTAYILFILLLWRRLSLKPISHTLYPLVFIGGILAGWSNEALSFGLAVGVTLELFHNYKKGNKPALYRLATGIAVGCIMIVISPGAWKRTGWVTHTLSRPELYISLLYALLIPGLLLLFIKILHRRQPDYIKEFINRYRICIIASIALIPVCVFTWQFAARSCYGMVLFALIPLISLIYQYITTHIKVNKVVKYNLVSTILIFTALLFNEHNTVEKSHRLLIEQYQKSKDGTVALDFPQRAWYAHPFTLNLKNEYLWGWTPQHMATYYNGVPLQLMSTELYHLLNHPQELFCNNNKVAGENELYTTPTLNVYVVKTHTQQPDTLRYTYDKVSFYDDVPIQAKILRLIHPARYPQDEILPAYITTYKLKNFDTYHCIEKSIYREVTQIDYL